MTPLAGLIVADFNGIHRPLLTSSSETTLFGQGVRQGVMVRMPNQGNQWQPVYASPNIDVQVVDLSTEAVALEARRVTAELNDLLAKRQQELGVQPSIRATMIASSADPTIVYISGSRARALGAIGLLGMAITTISVYWIELLLVRRRQPGSGERGEVPSSDVRRPPVRGHQLAR